MPSKLSQRFSQIDGTTIDDYNGHQATELDSHANMAVAGCDCTINHSQKWMFCKRHSISQGSPCDGDDWDRRCDGCIWRSNFAEDIYLLVMTSLLIHSMDHNLIPPFLIREAGLLLDETPKHQLEHPTIDNHAIVDPVTGMRIHLSLNGIFS